MVELTHSESNSKPYLPKSYAVYIEKSIELCIFLRAKRICIRKVSEPYIFLK